MPRSPVPPDEGRPDLILKVMPPRMPNELIARRQLPCPVAAWQEHAVWLIQAPAGFGKSTVLMQWRKALQSAGVAAAWVQAQAGDEPARLIQSLALAVRVASGKPCFGRACLAEDGGDSLARATQLLAELTQLAQQTALLLDAADVLPEASQQVLIYLMHHMPPNVRLCLTARPECALDVDALMAYGQCRRIDEESLRFDLHEALQLAQRHWGPGADTALVARLHAWTEGWPLGFRLALSWRERGGAWGLTDAPELTGAYWQRLDTLLLASLSLEDRDFLTRIALLDLAHPALCGAVTGYPDAAQRLERLSRQTPIFMRTEDGQWLRMQTLVREMLRQYAKALPESERQGMHARAAHWLGERGFLHEAARHAFAAGQSQLAYDLAERSLYGALVQHDRCEAINWLLRIPADEIQHRPRLLLTMVWMLAGSDRHEQIQALIARIQASADTTEPMRQECALLLSAAAIFADDPDRYMALCQTMRTQSLIPDSAQLEQMRANRLAYQALLSGAPAQARRLLRCKRPTGDVQEAIAPTLAGEVSRYTQYWAWLVTGLTHIWEGQMVQAMALLEPIVQKADRELGRRHQLSCMLAAMLAHAQWENGRIHEPAVLLADRLDVLERCGLPDMVWMAYRCQARMAMAQGHASQAWALLAALDAVAEARQLQRLRVAALLEQVRLHAWRGHAHTCRNVCDTLTMQMRAAWCAHGPLWQGEVQALHDLAQAYASMAAHDWGAAVAPLARAEAHARQLGQGRRYIELLALRALALRGRDPIAPALLREAQDLAQVYGLRRVLDEAHPELSVWVAGLRSEGGVAMPTPLQEAQRGPLPPSQRRHGGMLTPKEHEVLRLLARGLSNKEIGRVMSVGETTVKWHVKNLFAKLTANDRKQAAQRALLLGLLAAEDVAR